MDECKPLLSTSSTFASDGEFIRSIVCYCGSYCTCWYQLSTRSIPSSILYIVCYCGNYEWPNYLRIYEHARVHITTIVPGS